MRITILAIGSRGDVQPLIALAVGLQQTSRHTIRFAAPNNFEALGREHGLDFFPLGVNTQELMETEELKAGIESDRNFLLWFWLGLRTIRPMIKRLMERTWLSCQDAETIVFSTLGIGAYHIAEKLGVPCFLTTPIPGLAPTRTFPDPGGIFPSLPLGGGYNLLTYFLTGQILQALTGAYINRWRREQLHLPAIPLGKYPYNQLHGQPLPVLGSYSSIVVPRPPDWGEHIHVTGYWFLEPTPNWQPPARLVDFLENGSPPVYVGFGSMASRAPRQITQLVREALEGSGQRGVLATGWGGLDGADLPANLFALDSVPHAWLFPRVSAVVHHGGSGTTGAGLRAGVPSVLVPHIGDQPLWAQRVTKLGVGPRPIPRRQLTTGRLAAAITSAITDAGMQARAARWVNAFAPKTVSGKPLGLSNVVTVKLQLTTVPRAGEGEQKRPCALKKERRVFSFDTIPAAVQDSPSLTGFAQGVPVPKREIYLLSPKQLSPETIAVAFARTSRAPESFREIAAELTDEKSAQFHEKWVVGYGHASVAEHAVLHLAIENASRLAMEAIESNRLASYTEKSTRYQKWDADSFYVPAELDGHPLRDEYIAACRDLFQTYAASLPLARNLVEQASPRRAGESDEAWDRRIRSQYVDSCRFLLPAASLANVGMTANGRVLENAIRKWRSSPLAEVREIGETVKDVARGEIPTLVKYAEPVEYVMETSAEIEGMVKGQRSKVDAGDWCTLVDYDKDGEERVLASALYRFGNGSYSEALGVVRSSSAEDTSTGSVQGLAGALLKRLGRHDVPLRELEHIHYTFDMVMDQGAYAEFKRHRMMTQTPQRLTCALGYATPRRIVEAGFEAKYRRAMDAAGALWGQLAAWNPDVAQYVVPNGYNRRVLATFNLREAFAFCQLRAAANAHFSMRRVAQRVAEEIARVHPLLAGYMKLHDETWQSIESEYFAGTDSNVS